MTSRSARRGAGRFVAIAVALAAFALALVPWAGGVVPAVDVLAPAWPLAPFLACIALALSPPLRPAALLALAALAACAALLGEQRPARADAADAGFALHVVTHNVWVDNADPAGTAEALAATGADVLLLQEVDGSFARQLPMLRRLYPYSNACKTRCSLAILSRYPIDRVRYRFRDASGRAIGPGLIQTRIHLPGGIVAPLVTIHLPRGRAPAADARARRGLAAVLAQVDPGSLIVAGDFNLVPWSARLRALDDALRPVRRATAVFSYPARTEGGRFPFPLVPIDHFYAGAGWRVASVQQLPATGSDHLPVAVDLVWHGDGAVVPVRANSAGEGRRGSQGQ